MNIQTITDSIEKLPTRQSFLSLAYDLRDIFKEKAENLAIYSSDTVIQDINSLINLLANLRKLVNAAEASEKLHATLTSSKQ